jgi:hypothetical protein
VAPTTRASPQLHLAPHSRSGTTIAQICLKFCNNVHTLNNFRKLRDFAEFKIQFCLISTLPLWVFVCKQNQATDSEKKVSWTLSRDENFNFRAALWADLHGLLFNALPSNIFFWGHLFLSFCVSDDKTSVKVKAKVLQTDETIEIVGNLLVAADGSLSSIRQSFFSDFKLRFATKFESEFV